MTITSRLVLVFVLVPVACAQSFNIDIGSLTPGAPGSGAPASSYEAAAHQPGVWNSIAGIGTDSFPLVDLSGRPSTVTCRRSDGQGGLFGFDSSMTTGDFESLMDDGQNFGALGVRVSTYWFVGLAPGRYVVTTYAWSPLDPTARTRVTVIGSTSPIPQIVGGALGAVDTFAAGITHAVEVVYLAPGATLTVRAETAIGAGIIDGIQISNSYQLTISQPWPGGAITMRDVGGAPGNYFLNLMTLTAGSFPNGPIFGLDMSLAEALNEVSAGAPFFGVLDAEGSMTFVVPPPVPAGLVVYCVGLEADPSGVVASRLSPFSVTIQ